MDISGGIPSYLNVLSGYDQGPNSGSYTGISGDLNNQDLSSINQQFENSLQSVIEGLGQYEKQYTDFLDPNRSIVDMDKINEISDRARSHEIKRTSDPAEAAEIARDISIENSKANIEMITQAQGDIMQKNMETVVFSSYITLLDSASKSTNQTAKTLSQG
jgi:fibronectin type 3 domain-containing protein